MLAGHLWEWVCSQGACRLAGFMRSDGQQVSCRQTGHTTVNQGPLGHSRDVCNSLSLGGGRSSHQVVSFPSQEGGWELQFTEPVFTGSLLYSLHPPLVFPSRKAPLIQYIQRWNLWSARQRALPVVGGWGRKGNLAIQPPWKTPTIALPGPSIPTFCGACSSVFGVLWGKWRSSHQYFSLQVLAVPFGQLPFLCPFSITQHFFRPFVNWYFLFQASTLWIYRLFLKVLFPSF